MQAVTNIEGDMARKKEEKAKRCISDLFQDYSTVAIPFDMHFFLFRDKELAKVVVKKDDIELIVSLTFFELGSVILYLLYL